MKVEVAVLGSPSLTVFMISVEVIPVYIQMSLANKINILVSL